MLPLHNLSLALHNAGNVAASCRTHADSADKVVEVLKAFADQPKPVSLDTEALAKALLPLGLCIVHVNVIRQAQGVVKKTDAESQAEYDMLANLQTALGLAIEAKAQDDGN
jgi:hypothetical protein